MRKLAKAAAALTAGCMLLSTSAFAMTDNIDGTAQLVNGAFTVNIENLGAGQSTIMVLKGDTALADANESNILYINQDAIVDGKASYNVNLGADFEGTATVYAGGTNETATTLGVLSAAPKVVEVTDLTLVADVTELEIGETATLTATVIPADATDPTVTWSENVVANGTTATFTATEAGEFTVTATAGTVTKEVKITVKEKEPEYTLGDVYVGGGITLADALAVLDHVKGIGVITDAAILKAADAYPGGGITLADALAILDHVKGISSLN